MRPYRSSPDSLPFFQYPLNTPVNLFTSVTYFVSEGSGATQETVVGVGPNLSLRPPRSNID